MKCREMPSPLHTQKQNKSRPVYHIYSVIARSKRGESMQFKEMIEGAWYCFVPVCLFQQQRFRFHFSPCRKRKEHTSQIYISTCTQISTHNPHSHCEEAWKQGKENASNESRLLYSLHAYFLLSCLAQRLFHNQSTGPRQAHVKHAYFRLHSVLAVAVA